MGYRCTWCEREREGFPAGEFTRIQDGFDLERPVWGAQRGVFHPKYVAFKNTRLCDECMRDRECTGENFLKRYREREAAKLEAGSREASKA